ncbi:MAG: hypothetical protein LBR60_05230 [Fibrobacter sp.]|nr:hypothetical protein [Fibrobacter sp.]
MKYAFLFLLLIFLGCEEHYTGHSVQSEPLGRCEAPELSKEKLQFDVQGGQGRILTNGSSWWLNDFSFQEENCKMYFGSDSGYCADHYCEWDGIMKAECDWFELTKIGVQSILVSVIPNESGKERRIDIGIQAGNCGTGFTITQSAE